MMTKRRFSNLMDALVGRFSEKDFQMMNEDRDHYGVIWTSWYRIDDSHEDDYLKDKPEIVVALYRNYYGGRIWEIDDEGDILFEKDYDDLGEMFTDFMIMIDK